MSHTNAELQSFDEEDPKEKENWAASQPETARNTRRLLTNRYVLALSLTALLFLTSYFLLWTILGEQANYANEISIVGRQNTLNQRIVKTALLIQDCQDEEYCLELNASLKAMVKAWEKAQKGLQYGDKDLNLNGQNSPTIHSLFEKVNFYYTPMLRAAKSLCALDQDIKNENIDWKIKAIVGVILANESYYTDQMSEISALYNAEAQSHVKSLNTIQLFVMLIAFAVLFLQVKFIFEPIAKKIDFYFTNYETAQREAEEKNIELSEAFEQLKKVEEITRKNAEEMTATNESLILAQEKLRQTYQELSEKNRELQQSYDIIKSNKQVEESRFFDNALAHFGNIMRWDANQNIYGWTDHLLNHLIPYVNGLQAIVYSFDFERNNLFAIGGYALDKRLILSYEEVEIGENLIGQVAKSQKSIYFKDFSSKNSHFTTETGTFAIHPRAILVLPLVFNEKLVGVIEITSAKPFEEKYLELLNRMSESIASNMSTIQDQKRISQLFADSQLAEKKLKKSLSKLKENEERFRKLSEVTQEGLLFLNDDIIRDTNSVLVKMMGYEKTEELINTSYTSLVAPKYRYEIIHNKILEDEKTHETVGIRKDGSIFPIEIQSRKVTYGGDLMTVISIHDITEKKRTERQLEEANRIASLVNELEKKNRDITSSLEYAQRIQNAILPTEKVFARGFSDKFVLYIPKDIVSGDFYWYAEKEDTSLIAAVDCTGHGVPGAFMSIIGYSNLNKIVLEKGFTDPQVILSMLDREVTEILKQKEDDSDSRDGMDISLCTLDRKKKKLTFSGAYRPMYLLRNKELSEFKGSPFPIGGKFKFKKQKVFFNETIDLQKGDTLYIFSDGYADQFGGNGSQKFMTKNFKNLLINLQEHTMDEQKHILHYEFESWRGDHKQMDDILIIGLRY